jgi:hypothetical protein
MTCTNNPRTWRLAPGVHATAVDDDVVFLDVAADAYSCLPGGAAALRLAPDGGVRLAAPGLAQMFVEAGLICPSPSPALPSSVRKTAPRPSASALRDVYSAVRLGDSGDLTRALADLALHYRGKSFAQILRHAGGRPQPHPVDTPARDLFDAVDRFHRWVPYAPVSGKCLLRSFMLRGHLRRAGFDALWVFGVATWPFSAHCWLQSGETVLDETVERARAFTPILVL